MDFTKNKYKRFFRDRGGVEYIGATIFTLLAFIRVTNKYIKHEDTGEVMNIEFNDLHVVVTGGTGGLGSVVVNELLEMGAKVSIPVHNEAHIDRLEFAESGRVNIVPGVDLTDEEATQSFYDEAVLKFGKLWASLNIAGGFAMGKIGNTGLAKFLHQINMNTVTCYNCCRAAINQIRQNERGGGRIVNVVARPAIDPRQGAGMTAYTASKAAIAALTQALAAELSGEQILVNAVAPSAIDTPANRKAMPNADFTKWVKPSEIARQMIFLASKENTATSGGIVPVFGKS